MQISTNLRVFCITSESAQIHTYHLRTILSTVTTVQTESDSEVCDSTALKCPCHTPSCRNLFLLLFVLTSSLSSLSILRSRPDAQDLKRIKKDTRERERETERKRERERAVSAPQGGAPAHPPWQGAGHKFTCFTRTKVQMLTSEDLHVHQLSQLPHLRD